METVLTAVKVVLACLFVFGVLFLAVVEFFRWRWARHRQPNFEEGIDLSGPDEDAIILTQGVTLEEVKPPLELHICDYDFDFTKHGIERPGLLVTPQNVARVRQLAKDLYQQSLVYPTGQTPRKMDEIVMELEILFMRMEAPFHDDSVSVIEPHGPRLGEVPVNIP